MLKRPHYLNAIEERLKANPVVALLGPRQGGKTTLARQIKRADIHYFDLEDPTVANRLTKPKTVLEPLTGLVVLDEIQRMPALFPLLRVLADRKPLPARFLILGSASPGLMRGISESLAGRVSFVDINGFDLVEVGTKALRKLWCRGGFPRAFLADSDVDCRRWQEDFLRTILERDLPQLGINIPAMTLRRFLIMLAHYHGQIWNSAELARSLGSSEPTARRYLDMFASMFLVRELPPWFENLSKRQVKSPKVYIRDSGLLNCLLGLETFAALEGHPKLGASWEGFALEGVLRVTGDRDAYFWATHTGAELDLLVHWRGKRWGFEFKYSDGPVMTKSLHIALADLKPERVLVVYPGKETYVLHERVEVVPLTQLNKRLTELGGSKANRKKISRRI
jgi:uncharacterized protein